VYSQLYITLQELRTRESGSHSLAATTTNSKLDHPEVVNALSGRSYHSIKFTGNDEGFFSPENNDRLHNNKLQFIETSIFAVSCVP